MVQRGVIHPCLLKYKRLINTAGKAADHVFLVSGVVPACAKMACAKGPDASGTLPNIAALCLLCACAGDSRRSILKVGQQQRASADRHPPSLWLCLDALADHRRVVVFPGLHLQIA
jgi:hypothetical protein